MVDYMFVFGKDIGNEYSKYISGETKVIGSYINNYVKRKKKTNDNIISFISQYDPIYEKKTYMFNGNKKTFVKNFFL